MLVLGPRCDLAYICSRQKSKNGKFAEDRKRLQGDFSPGNTGGWGGGGGVSNRMIMIGNLRVIKGLTYVMI